VKPDSALFVVVGAAAGAVLLAWLYFRRFRVTRPPIGVMNLRDVALMIGAIVLVPYLYLAVPAWLAAMLLGLGMLTVLQVTFEPLLPAPWIAWAVALGLLGIDVAAALVFGAPRTPFLLANNTILAIAIIGAANLWAQSGLKARDAAVLGAALVVYDFVATSLLPLTNNLVGRQAGLPFAPLIAWTSGGDQCLGVALIAYGFSQLGLAKIWAHVDPRNAASVRALEKLGMKREAFLRSHVLRHGERADRAYYGLLRHEWPGLA
jgi:hypothetical protein